jgi:predicted lipoprotein with Yx(FWY)xxD motif
MTSRTLKPAASSEGLPRRSTPGRRWLVGGALVVIGLAAAACGSSAASSLTSSHSSGAKATLVTVGSATNGHLGTILVDQSGRTLYRYTPDGVGKTTCTGTCATIWPPLTLPSGTTHVTATGGVTSSELGTIVRPGGTLQVTFAGMPLYLYSGDNGPGQVNGQGVAGTWFVVSPTAKAATTKAATTKAAAPTTSTAPTSATPTTAPSSMPAVTAPATAHAATSPPATAPPVTATPATAPPSTSPPATSPPATSPPATSPPTSSPSTTQGGGGYGY